MANNERVYRRAMAAPESTCRECPCFTAYQVGSPGYKRGEIGACTYCRAEQPELPKPPPGKLIWAPRCEGSNG